MAETAAERARQYMNRHGIPATQIVTILHYLEQAQDEEREACAQVAFNFYDTNNVPATMAQEVTALDIAKAVRFRNKAA